MKWEHSLISILGLICVCICSFKGHGDVAPSIATIVLAGCGGSAVKSWSENK